MITEDDIKRVEDYKNLLEEVLELQGRIWIPDEDEHNRLADYLELLRQTGEVGARV